MRNLVRVSSICAKNWHAPSQYHSDHEALYCSTRYFATINEIWSVADAISNANNALQMLAENQQRSHSTNGDLANPTIAVESVTKLAESLVAQPRCIEAIDKGRRTRSFEATVIQLLKPLTTLLNYATTRLSRLC